MESQDVNNGNHLTPIKVNPQRNVKGTSVHDSNMNNDSSYDSSFSEEGTESINNDLYLRKQSTFLQKSVKSSTGGSTEHIVNTMLKGTAVSVGNLVPEEEKKSKSDSVSIGLEDYDKLTIPG